MYRLCKLRVSNPFIMLFSLFLVTACGGGGGSSDSPIQDNSSRDSGSVTVLLTDAPADPELFSAINATIERIELIGTDDGRVEIFDGPAETVDLLSLQNESMPFAFSDEVPQGRYCKIRLTLTNPDGLELVLAEDERSYFPHIPGNGKLDLQPRECFTLSAGQSLTLQLDLDAGNSIHVVRRGNNDSYNFRPVVFVDVLGSEFVGRLLRLDGVVSDFDAASNSLLLCDALPSSQSGNRDCVKVFLGDDSAFFNNDGATYQGDARPLTEIFNELNLGKSARVVGLHRQFDYPYDDFDLPIEDYPPAGECRIWKMGVETVDQLESGICSELADSVPSDAILIDAQGVILVDRRPRMAIDGLAVELGEFQQTEGVVNLDADPQRFVMESATGELQVELQTPQGYNGTRIITKHGALLDYSAVVTPNQLEVDGVLSTDTNSLLSAVVVVDSARSGETSVSGTIASLVTNGFILLPENSVSVCGVTGDLNLTLTEDVEITLVTITQETADVSRDAVLEAGQTVSIQGVCDGEGLSAHNIVIIDDQRL